MVISLVFLSLLAAQFSSVQFKVVSMRSEKVHMRSTPSLTQLPNVAFETVPVFSLTDDGPFSSFQGKSSSASSFHASLLQEIDGVNVLGFVPADSVSSSPTR